VVLVQGPRPSNPFDIYTDRKLCYRLQDGAPDPAGLAEDRAALATMARATLQSSARRKVSPVYALLPHLREPPWRDLLLDERNEFGAAYEQWRGRMEVARQKNRAGDILVLAGETPTQALWLEAKRDAGISLMKLRQFSFAARTVRRRAGRRPDDASCRNRRIVCLGRLGRHEEAHEAARQLTADRPRDPEVWALAGRVEKDRWLSRWRSEGAAPAELRQAATLELASLEEAIEPYHQAFLADPSHHYSGINSLTLHRLLLHLGGEVSLTLLDNLTGGVLWRRLSAQQRDARDYWAKASYAELCLLLNPLSAVVREFRAVAAAAKGDWFALDSTRPDADAVRDLEYRPAETARRWRSSTARSPARCRPLVPRQVLLFSGPHGRRTRAARPRFPASMVRAPPAAIERVLDEMQAGDGDLALDPGRGRRRPHLRRGLRPPWCARAAAAAAARARIHRVLGDALG